MDFKSEQKFILMSPKKLRQVKNSISAVSNVSTLIDYLPHVERRAGGPLLKVLKTAVANAKQAGTDIKDLVVKEIMINEGPRIRRGRAGSRGRVKPYRRRMSHIRVILKTKELVKADVSKVVEKVKTKEDKSVKKTNGSEVKTKDLKKKK